MIVRIVHGKDMLALLLFFFTPFVCVPTYCIQQYIILHFGNMYICKLIENN